MPTVRLPEALARYAGGTARFEAGGATVGEVLGEALRLHPELRARLVGEDGRIHGHLALFRNEAALARSGLEDVPVAPGDVLTFVEAIGGG